ncbi:hypothetical protein MERGE_001073 [Pneumocystis wakefieldiae]|uniref:Kinetochore protein Spc24 n=1 Tax=Pneumocystis wakefieldiae TaxID=38082 RepID=A0A899G5K7_9ASCO|nr:hypothetical protein MERGE_001073 [Pneumocystis wakefieldiae]
MMVEMPQELIQSTLSGFQIDLDLQSISRIRERLEAIGKNREIKQHNIKAVSKNLERQLEISRSSVQAFESSPSRAEHASTILAMDRDKFSLAKNINDLESSIHTLDTTYSRLKEELEELESDDIMKDSHEMTDDSILLRLKIYRTLGIDLHEDEAGNYVKAIIRIRDSSSIFNTYIE